MALSKVHDELNVRYVAMYLSSAILNSERFESPWCKIWFMINVWGMMMYNLIYG